YHWFYRILHASNSIPGESHAKHANGSGKPCHTYKFTNLLESVKEDEVQKKSVSLTRLFLIQ
ncbi:hypothetical protein KKA14_09660, partial [bacterium]|nr:hypothetical protein [bacterium]